MTFRILAFGIAQDIMGGKVVDIVTTKTVTNVAEIKTLLIKKYPELGTLASLLIAVNKNYANNSTPIESDDEIAIIPPTSGG